MPEAITARQPPRQFSKEAPGQALCTRVQTRRREVTDWPEIIVLGGNSSTPFVKRLTAHVYSPGSEHDGLMSAKSSGRKS